MLIRIAISALCMMLLNGCAIFSSSGDDLPRNIGHERSQWVEQKLEEHDELVGEFISQQGGYHLEEGYLLFRFFLDDLGRIARLEVEGSLDGEESETFTELQDQLRPLFVDTSANEAESILPYTYALRSLDSTQWLNRRGDQGEIADDSSESDSSCGANATKLQSEPTRSQLRSCFEKSYELFRPNTLQMRMQYRISDDASEVERVMIRGSTDDPRLAACIARVIDSAELYGADNGACHVDLPLNFVSSADEQFRDDRGVFIARYDQSLSEVADQDQIRAIDEKLVEERGLIDGFLSNHIEVEDGKLTVYMGVDDNGQITNLELDGFFQDVELGAFDSLRRVLSEALVASDAETAEHFIIFTHLYRGFSEEPSGETTSSSSDDVGNFCEPDDIASAISSKTEALTDCYNNSHRVLSGIPVHMMTRFRISLDGSAKRVLAPGNTTDVEMLSCVAEVIESIDFVEPDGGLCDIHYPFVFSR